MPNYRVEPMKGCNTIIDLLAAERITSSISIPNDYYMALIDKDFRQDKDMAHLRKYKIYTLNVAAVESIYCSIPVLQWVFGDDVIELGCAYDKLNKLLSKNNDLMIKRKLQNMAENFEFKTGLQYSFFLVLIV